MPRRCQPLQPPSVQSGQIDRHIYIYIYIYTYIHIYATHTHIYLYIYIYIYICIYMYMYMYTYMYIPICICMYACMYLSLSHYIHISLCISIYTSALSAAAAAMSAVWPDRSAIARSGCGGASTAIKGSSRAGLNLTLSLSFSPSFSLKRERYISYIYMLNTWKKKYGATDRQSRGVGVAAVQTAPLLQNKIKDNDQSWGKPLSISLSFSETEREREREREISYIYVK